MDYPTKPLTKGAKGPELPPGFEANKNPLAFPQLLGKINKGQQIELYLQAPVAAKTRNASWEVAADTKIWKKGNEYAPAWFRRGEPRPQNKHSTFELPQSMKPLKNVTVFPSVDPYSPQARALFRVLMQKESLIFKCNHKMAQLVITDGTTTIHSRADDDLSSEILNKFRQTPIYVPYFGMEKTPNEVKAFVDKLMRDLHFKDVLFEGYMDKREQGRGVMGLFPEYRVDGKYVLPQILRVFEPEFVKRPLLNYDTGELEAVQIVGVNSNGGYLDKDRMLYIVTVNNNKFFSTYYGKSDVEAVEDAGKVLILINAKDYIQAAEYTWHKPRIFKLTIPARDYARIDEILNKFNFDLNNSAGKDISVTQSVENITGSMGDHGDIAGLALIENQKIEEIIGYYGIPPFMVAKGKAGRLGGNANQEEVESFLETDVRPEQEKIENLINEQIYDKILAILFDVEPDEVNDAEKVPLLLKHHFRKPKVHTLIDKEQYEIKKDMVGEGLITVEKLARDLGIEDELATPETDTNPMQNPWWNQKPRADMQGWKPKNLRVGSPSWPTGWPQYDDWNNKDQNGWPSPPGKKDKSQWKAAI